MTSAGLMTFLNELTSERPKPTIAPANAKPKAFCTAASSVARSPTRNHAAAAVAMTTPRVRAVFSTVDSMVMTPVPRPVDVCVGPGCEVEPSRSSFHCDGSVARAVLVPRPLNPSDRLKTGLLLCMVPSGNQYSALLRKSM